MENFLTFFNLIDQIINAGLRFKCCCSICVNFRDRRRIESMSIGAGRCGPIIRHQTARSNSNGYSEGISDFNFNEILFKNLNLIKNVFSKYERRFYKLSKSVSHMPRVIYRAIASRKVVVLKGSYFL